MGAQPAIVALIFAICSGCIFTARAAGAGRKGRLVQGREEAPQNLASLLCVHALLWLHQPPPVDKAQPGSSHSHPPGGPCRGREEVPGGGKASLLREVEGVVGEGREGHQAWHQRLLQASLGSAALPTASTASFQPTKAALNSLLPGDASRDTWEAGKGHRKLQNTQ